MTSGPAKTKIPSVRKPKSALGGVIILVTVLHLSSASALAKTAACTCSPCTCSPCTCSSKSSSKHHDHGKGKEHEHGHAAVGVGANVDLGGVGQRKAESDPFTASNESHAPKTQDKKTPDRPKSKRPSHEDTTFEKVELTSAKAKDSAAAATAPEAEKK